MPVLAIGGEVSYGEHVADAMRPIAADVQPAVIAGAGHWVAEQAPDALLAALTPFLAPYRTAATAAGGCGQLAAMASRLHMPALDGATEWLDAEPLGPAELRGHVVLVNFWTLTCINWLRQAPHVKAWARAYRDDGLIVIGVHTPEFSFEHVADRVRQAVAARSIDYPVVIDNDYAVWSAFANHYWPALYFVDADGVIRDEHHGEGSLRGIGTAHPAAARRRARPRRRRGGRRRGARRLGAPAHARDLPRLRPGRALRHPRRRMPPSTPATTTTLPSDLDVNSWALSGEWTIASEAVVLEHAGGTHQLPVPRSRCPPRARRRSGGADPVPRPRRRRRPGPGPRRRRRRGRQRRAPRRPPLPARAPTRRDPRTDAARSRSSASGAEAYAFTFG